MASFKDICKIKIMSNIVIRDKDTKEILLNKSDNEVKKNEK